MHQKYWWLRSPDTNHNGYAWYVYPDGDVINDFDSVTYSYGKYFIRLYIIRIDKYNLVFI